VQECILKTIRESIPTEDIIRAYMDESIEQEEEVIIEDVKEDVKEDEEGDKSKESDKEKTEETMSNEIEAEEPPPQVPTIKDADNEPVVTKLTFNDYDNVMDSETGNTRDVSAPKSLERLEEISSERAIQRQLEEEEDLDDKIQIHTDNIDLGEMDILDMTKKTSGTNDNSDVLINDVVELL